MAKLIEGKSYSFKVDGIITLPGGKSYFKIIDPNGVNHMLDHTIYQHYGFTVGDFITCRVDKINCTGRIFLEPKHPLYKLGGSYKFIFDRTISIKNTIGSHEKIAVFRDHDDRLTKIPLDDLHKKPAVGKSYKFIVSGIKQGQLFISVPGSKNNFSGLTENNSYKFTVNRLKTYASKYEYYVIVNPEGKEFLLRTKFYKKYNFGIGDSIECKFRIIKEEAFLEPKHPFYIIGKTYVFDVMGETMIHLYPSGEEEAVILRNKFGKNILIAKNQIKKINNNKVKCKVTDIVKSRIYISCI